MQVTQKNSAAGFSRTAIVVLIGLDTESGAKQEPRRGMRPFATDLFPKRLFESDFASWLVGRRFHQPANGIKYYFELRIVFLLHRR